MVIKLRSTVIASAAFQTRSPFTGMSFATSIFVATGEPRKTKQKKTIKRLEDYPEPYVTVGILADYWAVSRKQIYKQIEMGTLTAVRFGPRLLRISTAEALRFEREAKMIPAAEQESRSTRLHDIRTKPVKSAAPVRADERHPAHHKRRR